MNGQGNCLCMFCRSLDATQRNNAYILVHGEGMEKRAIVDRSKLSKIVKEASEEYSTAFHTLQASVKVLTFPYVQILILLYDVLVSFPGH